MSPMPTRLAKSDPPTAKQVEAFQALVIHRVAAEAARQMGVTDVRKAVHGFLTRAAINHSREFRSMGRFRLR